MKDKNLKIDLLQGKFKLNKNNSNNSNETLTFRNNLISKYNES